MDMQKPEEKKMVKVTILKYVGGYTPGQEVEVDEEMAKHLCVGDKAIRTEDVQHSKSADGKDVKSMSVAQMIERGLKNAPEMPEDIKTLHKTEMAALQGRPVEAGEPITVTGGVTPPSTVFPALAKAAGQATTKPEELDIKKPEAKKVDDKKPADQKPPVQPEKK